MKCKYIFKLIKILYIFLKYKFSATNKAALDRYFIRSDLQWVPVSACPGVRSCEIRCVLESCMHELEKEVKVLTKPNSVETCSGTWLSRSETCDWKVEMLDIYVYAFFSLYSSSRYRYYLK
jgi:hypothetical protein